MPKPLMDGLPAGEESKFTSTPVSVLHDVGVAAVGRRLGCCTHSHRSPVIPKGYIGFGQARVHNLLFIQQKERSPASFLQLMDACLSGCSAGHDRVTHKVIHKH